MIDGFLKDSTQSAEFGTVQYGDDLYDFNVILYNPEGKAFVFRTGGIEALHIEDSISNYYQSGYIVVKNDFDLLERPGQDGKSYMFRGDSRDSLRISITPKINVKNSSRANEKTKTMFALNYDFVIYNIEEMATDNPSQKLKKLYFWDLHHQILIEKNINFSTAKLGKDAFSNNKEAGSVSTGAAIQEVLKKTFPISDGFKLAFGKFDAGGTDIFFSSPTGYKAADCLEYLLSKHVSTAANNFDWCLLSIDRYPKVWSLISMKEYFDNAYDVAKNAGGPLFLEKMLLGGMKGSNPNVLSTIISRSPAVSVYFSNAGTINNFSFVPPPGNLTQTRINTHMVHSYSYGNKDFAVDTESNSFANIKGAYNSNYVKNMLGQRGVPRSNLIGNTYRNTNQNISNVYSTSQDSKQQRLGVGRNEALYNAIMLNNSISFKVPGATYRQTGKFISIDRSDSTSDSAFDDKLLGIYMIVKVDHIFSGGAYNNEIVAVKTYNYKDLNQTEAVV